MSVQRESVSISMMKGQSSHSFCFAMSTGFMSFDMSIHRAKGTDLQKIPVLLHEVLLHDVKVGMWCAMSVKKNTWSYIFPDHEFTVISYIHSDATF